MFAEDDEENDADEWRALLEQGWGPASATKVAERKEGDKPSADVESLGLAALVERIAEDEAGQCDSKKTSGACVLDSIEISDAEEEAEEEVIEKTGEEAVEEEVEEAATAVGEEYIGEEAEAVTDSLAPMPPSVPGGNAHVAKRPEGKAPVAKRPPHVGKAPVARPPALVPRPPLGVGPTLGMRPQQPAPAGVGGAASSAGPRAPRPLVAKVGAKGCGQQMPPLHAAPPLLHGVAAAASGPTSGVQDSMDACEFARMLAAKAEGGKGGPGGKPVALARPAARPVGRQPGSKGKGRGAALVARDSGMAGRGRGAGGAALQPVHGGSKGSGKAGEERVAGVARIQVTAGPRTGAPGAPGRKPVTAGDLPEEVRDEAKRRAVAKVDGMPGASRLSEEGRKAQRVTWCYRLLKRYAETGGVVSPRCYRLLKRYAETGTWEPSRRTKKMARSANRFLGRAAGQRQDVKRNGKRKRADDVEWPHAEEPAEKKVVVDMANVGATYAKKVLGKKDGERNLFAWEGIRQCVSYLRDKGFKVVGVITEDFRGPETLTGSCLMPNDIRSMCESVEETPRLTGRHQRSADDEQVIRCAYNRKCFILGNDNYRDWMQQLKDKDIRDWYNQNRDTVHMSYYFDSGLGKFELLQGNVPD